MGQVNIAGGAKPAVRVDVNPLALAHYGSAWRKCARHCRRRTQILPRELIEDNDNRWTISATDQLLTADKYLP